MMTCNLYKNFNNYFDLVKRMMDTWNLTKKLNVGKKKKNLGSGTKSKKRVEVL